MTPEEELAKCERMVKLADDFFAMTKKPINVSNIPGELDRAVYIASWKEAEYQATIGVAQTRARYVDRARELRSALRRT